MRFKKHTLFPVIFAMIFLGNLLPEFGIYPAVRPVVKPLICISLAVYLIRSVNLAAGFNRAILAGLLLSLCGDVLLMFADANADYFVAGLIAFLMAHICYSSAFFRDFKNDPQLPKTVGHLMLLIMGTFSLSFYSVIRESLGSLRIPVLAYIFVISVMSILAGYRYKRVNLYSFRTVIFGALLFAISDSLLAYNKFAEVIDYAGAGIMGTYMLAQYLITLGAIERVVLTKAP